MTPGQVIYLEDCRATGAGSGESKLVTLFERTKWVHFSTVLFLRSGLDAFVSCVRVAGA